MDPAMNPDRLDQILAAENELLPSCGFLSGVMDRVREEAAAPPPIPFPWRRALPGLLLFVAVLVWAVVSFARAPFNTAASLHLPAPALRWSPLAAGNSQLAHSALWLGIALAISLVAVLLSRRLAGHRGLL